MRSLLNRVGQHKRNLPGRLQLVESFDSKPHKTSMEKLQKMLGPGRSVGRRLRRITSKNSCINVITSKVQLPELPEMQPEKEVLVPSSPASLSTQRLITDSQTVELQKVPDTCM
jgi:hypothetical protein